MWRGLRTAQPGFLKAIAENSLVLGRVEARQDTGTQHKASQVVSLWHMCYTCAFVAVTALLTFTPAPDSQRKSSSSEKKGTVRSVEVTKCVGSTPVLFLRTSALQKGTAQPWVFLLLTYGKSVTY